ncbi:Transcription factor MYB118 [Linum perenne]
MRKQHKLRRKFSSEDDRVVKKTVGVHGLKSWSIIAKVIGRAGTRCRERWHNNLKPHIKCSIRVLWFSLPLFTALTRMLKGMIAIKLFWDGLSRALHG